MIGYGAGSPGAAKHTISLQVTTQQTATAADGRVAQNKRNPDAKPSVCNHHQTAHNEQPPRLDSSICGVARGGPLPVPASPRSSLHLHLHMHLCCPSCGGGEGDSSWRRSVIRARAGQGTTTTTPSATAAAASPPLPCLPLAHVCVTRLGSVPSVSTQPSIVAAAVVFVLPGRECRSCAVFP